MPFPLTMILSIVDPLPLDFLSGGQGSHELVDILLRWIILASIALAAAAPVPQ